MSERRRIVSRQGHPDFLDLPWHVPLADWTHPRMASVTRGLARHIVRFVRYENRVYAIKETNRKAAEHEYRQLRRLHDDLDLPTVEAVGIVVGRIDQDGNELGAALITRFLDYALPYRYLYAIDESEAYRSRLIDSLVVLIVRLHLNNFLWGDCSLSNALFRRDAGALAAYLVDAETGEFQPSVSKESREHDLELARINIVGGLFDLQSQGRLPVDVDPVQVVDDLQSRYEALWSELTRVDELHIEDRAAIEERVRRINQLGFDVEELSIEEDAEGRRLLLRPEIVEEGHHHRVLQRMTGLEVQENQARRLLGGLRSYVAWRSEEEGRPLAEGVGAYRWLTDRFEPLVASVPEEHRRDLEPAEIYHRFLDHRTALAAGDGPEPTYEVAVNSFVSDVVPTWRDERQLSSDAVDEPTEF